MPDKFLGKYRNESNRWQYWDYSLPGSYFITINVSDRESLLGKIKYVDTISKKKEVALSEYGKIVSEEFHKVNSYHDRVVLDVFIIMPDHVHMIVTLLDNKMNRVTPAVANIPILYIPDGQNTLVVRPNKELIGEEVEQYRRLRRQMLLVKVLGKFKQQTSMKINELNNTPAYRNWQRDYYDHVITSEGAFQRIKQYIINNPQKAEVSQH